MVYEYFESRLIRPGDPLAAQKNQGNNHNHDNNKVMPDLGCRQDAADALQIDDVQGTSSAVVV